MLQIAYGKFLIDGDLTCDGKIDQFQEIERGIWFPVVMTTRGYDEGGYMFRKDNPIQIGHTTTIKISRVTLNPKVPDGFFTAPANPIGATVILLKNGKPIKSFVEGKKIMVIKYILGGATLSVLIIDHSYIRSNRRILEACEKRSGCEIMFISI